MPWCFPVPDSWTTGTQVDYSVFGGGYTGNGDGTFTSTAGNLPAAWVSLQNDKDRLTGYLWSLVEGPDGPCICVDSDEPLPESIKWAVGGETAVTDFEEIGKEDVTDKKSKADRCFSILFGCTFSELLILCKSLVLDCIDKAIIATGLGVPDPPTVEVTRFCATAVNFNFTVDPDDGRAEVFTFNGTDTEIPVAWNGWTAAEQAQWIADTAGLDLEGTSLYSEDPFSLIFSGGSFNGGGNGPLLGQLWRFARPSLATVIEMKDCQAGLDCFEELFKCSLQELVGSIDIPLPEPNPIAKADLVAALAGIQKPIYRYTPATPGVQVEFWADEQAVPHGPVADIFTAPIDVSLTPGHVNGAPTLAQIEADFNSNTAVLGNNRTDQQRVYGWVYLQPGFVRDNNGNTGELGDVLLAQCGGRLTAGPGANDVTNTSGADRTLLDPTPVAEGWHFFVGRSSDFSAFGGFDLEWSATVDGAYANIAGWQVDRPTVECELIELCDPVPEGWQLKPIESCPLPVFA